MIGGWIGYLFIPRCSNEETFFVGFTLFITYSFQPRSEMIATYALCGFASFVDAGICVGAIGAMEPTRKSKLVFLPSAHHYTDGKIYLCVTQSI